MTIGEIYLGMRDMYAKRTRINYLKEHTTISEIDKVFKLIGGYPEMQEETKWSIMEELMLSPTFMIRYYERQHGQALAIMRDAIDLVEDAALSKRMLDYVEGEPDSRSADIKAAADDLIKYLEIYFLTPELDDLMNNLGNLLR